MDLSLVLRIKYIKNIQLHYVQCSGVQSQFLSLSDTAHTRVNTTHPLISQKFKDIHTTQYIEFKEFDIYTVNIICTGKICYMSMLNG